MTANYVPQWENGDVVCLMDSGRECLLQVMFTAQDEGRTGLPKHKKLVRLMSSIQVIPGLGARTGPVCKS